MSKCSKGEEDNEQIETRHSWKKMLAKGVKKTVHSCITSEVMSFCMVMHLACIKHYLSIIGLIIIMSMIENPTP